MTVSTSTDRWCYRGSSKSCGTKFRVNEQLQERVLFARAAGEQEAAGDHIGAD